jgi:hypothetical protein
MVVQLVKIFASCVESEVQLLYSCKTFMRPNHNQLNPVHNLKVFLKIYFILFFHFVLGLSKVFSARILY